MNLGEINQHPLTNHDQESNRVIMKDELCKRRREKDRIMFHLNWAGLLLFMASWAPKWENNKGVRVREKMQSSYAARMDAKALSSNVLLTSVSSQCKNIRICCALTQNNERWRVKMDTSRGEAERAAREKRTSETRKKLELAKNVRALQEKSTGWKTLHEQKSERLQQKIYKEKKNVF